eukprot:CAMPEP_0114448672 /NCGR_PEP_ID=MMETSP0103-20121206/20452_1 /TAXON_ID=37642 ORGANISM="Paraphysomonas imperforata, Strain PA2" /NCGR_SAMPLE_ID=MMETSP0103 /ASSEMBLY_ACC=CAM_ASM_000201 /LENGTH=83 /DNA_ID=CAMNT_0001620707 /DNA_START=536 /DNA_END=787 /DNA_ORIENTATION=-
MTPEINYPHHVPPQHHNSPYYPWPQQPYQQVQQGAYVQYLPKPRWDNGMCYFDGISPAIHDPQNPFLQNSSAYPGGWMAPSYP